MVQDEWRTGDRMTDTALLKEHYNCTVKPLGMTNDNVLLDFLYSSHAGDIMKILADMEVPFNYYPNTITMSCLYFQGLLEEIDALWGV